MSERLLNMLGLMRKAGAIDIGETKRAARAAAGRRSFFCSPPTLRRTRRAGRRASPAAGTSARPRFHSRRKRYPRMSA